MPELPDVAEFKRYFDSAALGKTVQQVDVDEQRLLEGISRRKFSAELKGRTFRSSRRHGKHLLVEPDAGRWLAMHFGMTGLLGAYDDPAARPEHAHVVFHLSDGSYLAYVSQRKLGRLKLVDRPEQFAEKEELGIDAMDEELTPERFQELITGKRISIKSALMDQSLIAGLGNIYGDEVLFHARINPNTQTTTMDQKTLRRLYRSMRKVLSTSIERQAQPQRLPRTYLLPHRDGECPRCGTQLKTKKVSGRTSHFCPVCQG